MSVYELCPQAFIFLCFSLTQVTIDTVKGEYNKAFFKFWIMIIFTLLLNNLCARGLGIISWTIIFMPFMLMSLVTAILLYVFGLDPTTGKLKYYTPDGAEMIGVDARGAVNVDSKKNTSEYARPIDLIKYRQQYPETSHDNNNFNPQSSKTQTNTVSQKSKQSLSNNDETHTTVYKKDDNKPLLKTEKVDNKGITVITLLN